jgi:hypothetical protein
MGMSRWKSFMYGQSSALVEPIAAVLGAFAVTFSHLTSYRVVIILVTWIIIRISPDGSIGFIMMYLGYYEVTNEESVVYKK